MGDARVMSEEDTGRMLAASSKAVFGERGKGGIWRGLVGERFTSGNATVGRSLALAERNEEQRKKSLFYQQFNNRPFHRQHKQLPSHNTNAFGRTRTHTEPLCGGF